MHFCMLNLGTSQNFFFLWCKQSSETQLPAWKAPAKVLLRCGNHAVSRPTSFLCSWSSWMRLTWADFIFRRQKLNQRDSINGSFLLSLVWAYVVYAYFPAGISCLGEERSTLDQVFIPFSPRAKKNYLLGALGRRKWKKPRTIIF